MKSVKKIILLMIAVLSVFVIGGLKEVNAAETDTLVWVDTPNNNQLGDNDSITIQGWIMTKSKNSNIQVLVDNVPTEANIVKMKRLDVLNTIKGYGDATTNPTPGYLGKIDISKLSKGIHTITVRAVSSDGSKVLSERKVNIRIKVYNTFLNVDFPTTNQKVKNSMSVQGWVMTEDKHANVQVIFNGQTYNVNRQARPDVINAIPGYGGIQENPTPGYTAQIDTSNVKDGSYTVTIKVIGETGELLKEQSKKINIKKYDTFVNVDFPREGQIEKDTLNIQGWVMTEDSQAKVQFIFNGKTYDVSRQVRPDVIKAIPGYGGNSTNPTPGFNNTIDISNIKDGKYQATIKVTSRTGEILAEQTKNFTVNKYNAYLNVDFPRENQSVKTSLNVQGWAMTEDSQAKVEVIFNGRTYETERQARPDVIKAISGYGGSKTNATPGYKTTIDTSDIKDGKYQVTIRVKNRIGEIISEQTKNINIKKYTAVLNVDTPYSNQSAKTSLYVQGWTMTEDYKSKVEVIFNGKTYETERQARPDVIKAISGYGGSTTNEKPGYTATIDTSKVKDGINTVKIRVIARTGEVLKEESKNINVKKYVGRVNIDYPQVTMIGSSTVDVQGWALSEELNDNIKVYIDNKEMTASITRYERPDVLSLVPGYGGKEKNPMPGYKTSINVSNVSTGKHTLKVSVISTFGDIIESSTKTIQIYKDVYFGVDVSKWQGNINFDALKATGQVDFMIARAGYYSESKGKFMKDEYFERNYSEAKRKNIPLGTYLYSYALNVEESRNEANALVSYLQSTGRNFELPVFFDIEDPSQKNIPKQQQTDMCNTFYSILKSSGYKVGIYASVSWLTNNIDLGQIPSDCDIWVAGYGVNDGNVPADKFKFPGNHDIWQYTSKGTISGISGDVDFNICYKKYF